MAKNRTLRTVKKIAEPPPSQSGQDQGKEMRKGGAGVLLPGRMCGCFRFLLKCGRQSCFLLRVAERPRQAAGEKGRIGDVGESEQENHRNQILRARFKYPAGEQGIEQDKTGQTQFTQGEGMTPVQGRNQNSGKHRRPGQEPWKGRRAKFGEDEMEGKEACLCYQQRQRQGQP